jgi:predicted transposase/invertase (TIGR01784 family)
MTYINPRVDIAFKKIFGVEENKDLLISLINSIVSEQDQVTDLTLLNPYNNKNFANDGFICTKVRKVPQ